MSTPEAKNDNQSGTDAPPGPGPDASSDEIIDDIDQTRKELVDTVDQLAAKLDVKAQASRQVQEVKDSAVTRVRAVTDELTDDDGKPTPAALGGLAAVVALVVALIVWRSRK